MQETNYGTRDPTTDLEQQRPCMHLELLFSILPGILVKKKKPTIPIPGLERDGSMAMSRLISSRELITHTAMYNPTLFTPHPENTGYASAT